MTIVATFAAKHKSAGHHASPALSSGMIFVRLNRVALISATSLLAAFAPIGAQSYHGWRLGLALGPMSPSRQLGPLAASLGGLGSAALTSSTELPIAVRAEGTMLWAPRGTNQRLPLIPCAPGSTGCIPQVQSPSNIHGYLGMSGVSGSILWQWRSMDVGQDYLVLGGGAFRRFREPRIGDAPTADASTVGSVHVGYGMRFGTAKRLGLELRYHRLGGGRARWFVPATLTLGY
jgi:hypothetical protein